MNQMAGCHLARRDVGILMTDNFILRQAVARVNNFLIPRSRCCWHTKCPIRSGRVATAKEQQKRGVAPGWTTPYCPVPHHAWVLLLMPERRRKERFEVCLDVVLEGGTGSARIADLSEGGCYIDTLHETHLGERLRLSIKLPTGEWLDLEGEVAHVMPPLGLGIRFINLVPAARKKIAWVVRNLSNSGTNLLRRRVV